jgi:hypothetical protein
MRRRDGTTFPAETQSSLILDVTGRAHGVRTLVRDITARKELEARLEEASVRDPLTGCFNRRHLDRKRAELEEPSAHWACPLSDSSTSRRSTTPTGTTRRSRRGVRPLPVPAPPQRGHPGAAWRRRVRALHRAHSHEEAQAISKRVVAVASGQPRRLQPRNGFRQPGERRACSADQVFTPRAELGLALPP